jgi:GWxTD domain-containing protein
MKKLFSSIGIILLTGVSVVSAKMTAYFSYCTFNQPQQGPYIETYLTVIGTSANFKLNLNNQYQSKIEVQWVLKQDDKIVYFDKYNLMSPELQSSKDPKPNFIDVKRIPAVNGSYKLELFIADKNSTDSSFKSKQDVTVNYPVENVSISDIQLLDSYKVSTADNQLSKGGYDLVPYNSDFYPETMESIKFYCEIYNTKLMLGDDQFLARYAIVNDNNKQVMSDLTVSKKMTTANVNALLGELPLNQVNSGNYTVTVEVRNKSNEVLARKAVFFQRSYKAVVKVIEPTDDFSLFDIENTFVAQITNVDSLKDYIACLYPISGNVDRQIAENQLKIADVKSMQQYLYYFWSRMDKVNPDKRWYEYKAEVDKVNASYATQNKRGYETERGRVYLQYGVPNTIEVGDNEPNTYPYEIWHYYTIGTQTNRKFVFYTHDRSNNDYMLLHSDVTGEVSAYDWQVKLHEKAVQYGVDMDADEVPKTYGDRSKENFSFPK